MTERRLHDEQPASDWDEREGHPAIGVTQRGAAVRIEFRRPESLNAMDSEMTAAMVGILRGISADDTVRAVLITGSGRAFSAGADIKAKFSTAESRAGIEADMRRYTTPLITTVREMPKPVIAGVNGAAAGVGCSLALACDLVVAAESAFFLLAFANLGLTADGGSSLTVPARVGLGRAFVMALLAERVPAAEAREWGLADRVVPDAEFAAVTEELLLRLAAGPTRSYAATKQLINRSTLAGLAGQLHDEATLQGELLHSADFVSAVDAFVDKRTPTFEGR